MKIPNPILINDIHIRPFLIIIAAFQLAVWGAIGLDNCGLDLGLMRQIICLVYLTFVPGILILRILRLHKLDTIETALYTVGLSLSTLMFTGAFINLVCPNIGISRPISIGILLICLNIVVLLLGLLSFHRDRSFCDPSYVEINEIFTPQVLFLSLILFLSIFGTYVVNFYKNNSLLLILIILIGLIAILASFEKIFSRSQYPVIIIVIAISLLFHNSLISIYLTGWDICLEYYLSNLVITNGNWYPSISETVNGMLSIVMIAPIYSIICGMNLTWTYKIIYPLLFSLVPIGLYKFVKIQTNEKVAFLSAFLFMSNSTFYSGMPALARQEIAEIFFILLLLVSVRNINEITRSILLIIFGASLIVSHYGTAYVFMLIIIIGLLISYLNKKYDGLLIKFKWGTRKSPSDDFDSAKDNGLITINYGLLFAIMALAWFIGISNSSIFDSIINIGKNIADSIYNDFLNPESIAGLKLINEQVNLPLHKINQVINYLNQFFILAGFLIVYYHKCLKFKLNYLVFSTVNLLLLLFSISIPFFGSALNMKRLYHITILSLSPFCIIGGLLVFGTLSKLIRINSPNKSLKILSIYLTISLLFNTGFVYEIFEGCSPSISLSFNSMEKKIQEAGGRTIDTDYIREQDVFGARWVSEKIHSNEQIFGEYTTIVHSLLAYGMISRDRLRPLYMKTRIDNNAFVYMGYLNVVNNVIIFRDPVTGSAKVGKASDLSPTYEEMDSIYSNGASKIFFV